MQSYGTGIIRRNRELRIRTQEGDVTIGYQGSKRPLLCVTFEEAREQLLPALHMMTRTTRELDMLVQEIESFRATDVHRILEANGINQGDDWRQLPTAKKVIFRGLRINQREYLRLIGAIAAYLQPSEDPPPDEEEPSPFDDDEEY